MSTKNFHQKNKSAKVIWMRFVKNNFLPIIAVFVLLIMIPVTVNLGRQISRLISEAEAVPANIVVDAGILQGILPRPFAGVAQGGELENDKKTLISILPVTGKLKALNMKYVRFDHIFNFPLAERLKEIRAVSAMGAFPVISLSYYPATVATSWTGRPYNWSAWETEVQSLIFRISSVTPNVYYEVWNEPDGRDFGNMSVSEYMVLYRHTVAAANRVKNVQPFKIGGPAMANPDNKSWMKDFVTKVATDKLRIDFLSWHRYHRDAEVFTRDLDYIDDILFTNNLSDRERLITEWGTDPRPGAVHRSSFEAAHFVAVTRMLLDRVQVATKFEARDGVFMGGGTAIKDGEGLGIFTYNGNDKPLTAVIRLLNKMGGYRILLGGEGTNVTGYATKNSDSTNIILVNFDKDSRHTEEVPISIRGLTPQETQIKKTVLDSFNSYGRTIIEQTTVDASGELLLRQIMQANSVVLLEIQPL